MATNGRIRRDRSGLADGVIFGHRKRRLINWKFALWLLAMACVGVVVWQFNAIQPEVLSMLGTAPTATPFPVVYAQNGDQAFWRGDLAAAILNYRQAVRLDPRNIAYRYELVRVLIYHSYEDRLNGKDVFDSAPDSSGKETLPVYSPNGGRQQGALQIAEQGILDNPANARAYSILCFARMAAEKYEDGLRACLRALELDPSDPNTWAFQSYAQYWLGRYDTALDSANKAVALSQQLNQVSIDAYIASARALWYKGRVEQAQTAFITAENVNPKLEFPYFEFANFALVRQKPEVAIEAYNRVLSNNPRSVKAYSRLCTAYFNSGDFKSASDNCDQALTIDPNYLDALAMKGQVLYRGRDYEDAIDTLDDCVLKEMDALNADPTFQRTEECWLYLGLAKYTLGRCDPVDEKDAKYPQGAVAVFTDLLDWATTRVDIDTANDGIRRCNLAFQGKYVTPTPRPTPTERPTPILPGA
ncbi:MAG TPA: tetratricopeptide repeat protein [Aggregatilineales bacterium]|nr:tetratricopeptide repeat protein [Aggregatilineales bacterium]